MNPFIYGIGGAAIGGLLLGWTVRDWKADSDQLSAQNDAIEAYQERAKEQSDASLRYDNLVQEFRQIDRTNRTTIREIYRDVEVPSECAAPDSVVSVLDNAIDRTNAAASGQSERALPTPSEAAPPTDRP